MRVRRGALQGPGAVASNGIIPRSKALAFCRRGKTFLLSSDSGYPALYVKLLSLSCLFKEV